MYPTSLPPPPPPLSLPPTHLCVGSADGGVPVQPGEDSAGAGRKAVSADPLAGLPHTTPPSQAHSRARVCVHVRNMIQYSTIPTARWGRGGGGRCTLGQRRWYPLHAGAEVVPTAGWGRGGGGHCTLGQRRWWPLATRSVGPVVAAARWGRGGGGHWRPRPSMCPLATLCTERYYSY